MTTNPFTYGNPISTPERFFGRQREVEQIISRLRNPEGESSSLVGERRIGKTSLLHYLMNPDVRRRYGVDDEHFIFIYSDLQMLDDNTTDTRLFQRLIRQISLQIPDPEIRQLADEVRQAAVIDNFALADLFDLIDLKGFHIVFLLDEFEKVTGNPNFGPSFFYGLRSLAIQYNLTLITSSRSALVDLTHSEEIKGSPFFNIFANIDLRQFSQEEALHFIQTSLENTDVRFSDGEIDLIIRLAGTHPFFLQAACNFLFDAYGKGLGEMEREKFLNKEFRDEARSHLEDYWRHSQDSEKIVLTSLALLDRQGKAGEKSFNIEQLQTLYSRSDQSLDRLEKRSLVVERLQGYGLFCLAFSDWIIAEISDTLRDQVSYEDWLNSNQGSMNRLSKEARQQFGDILPKVASSYRDLVIAWASDPKSWIAVAGLLKGVLS